MNFNFNSNTPIYLQVAFQIEEGILQGIFKEENQIPSTTEISKTYKINPTTVLKGVNLLVDENILEKRRGIGMFVRMGSKKIVFTKRKTRFLEENVASLLTDAKNLKISKEELIDLIEREYDK